MPGRFPLVAVALANDPFCEDGFCVDVAPANAGPIPGYPALGNVLTAPTLCVGGVTTWYRINPAAPGGEVLLATGASYRLTSGDVGFSVYAVITCPGDPIGTPTLPTDPVEPYNPLNISGNIVFTLANYTDRSPLVGCYNSTNAGVTVFPGDVSTLYPTFTFAATSILGWSSAGGGAYLQFTCDPPYSTQSKSQGIFIYLTGGAVIYRGPDPALYGITNNGDGFSTTKSTGYQYREVNLISVTLDGVPVLTQPEPTRTIPPVILP
jgi:hypothetical protein